MGIHGKSILIDGIHGKSILIDGDPWKTDSHRWDPWKIDSHRWGSMGAQPGELVLHGKTTLVLINMIPSLLSPPLASFR